MSNFVADVIRVSVDMQSPQLLVIFYEELLVDPVKVVERIADFLEYQPDSTSPRMSGKSPEQLGQDRESFIKQVALSVTTSPLFVGYSSRVGSTNQGLARFSSTSQSRFATEWDRWVKNKFQIASYESLFCTLTGREMYPYENEIEKPISRHDSPASLSRASSFSLFKSRQVPANSFRKERSGTLDVEDPHESGKTRGLTAGFLGFSRLSKALSYSSTASSTHDNAMYISGTSKRQNN